MKTDWTILIAVVGVLASLATILFALRGNRLDESAAQAVEARAWAVLVEDWQLAQLAAGRVVNGSRRQTEQYFGVLERYRDARFALADANNDGRPTASGQHPEFDRAFEELQEAREALGPYETAVGRVLDHFGDIADRLVRGRLNLAAVYAALGRDVVRARPTLRCLLAVSTDVDGCPAMIWPEVHAWRSLSLSEITLRVGWGDAMHPHRGAAGSIWLLEEFLADRAVEVGDAGHVGHFTLADEWDEDLPGPAFLAEVWRAVRPLGRGLATRWTWRAAGVVSRAHRRSCARPHRLRRRLAHARPIAVLRAARTAGRHLPDPRWLRPLELESMSGRYNGTRSHVSNTVAYHQSSLRLLATPKASRDHPANS